MEPRESQRRRQTPSDSWTLHAFSKKGRRWLPMGYWAGVFMRCGPFTPHIPGKRCRPIQIFRLGRPAKEPAFPAAIRFLTLNSAVEFDSHTSVLSIYQYSNPYSNAYDTRQESAAHSEQKTGAGKDHMNRYMQEKWSWIEGTHEMCSQLLDTLSDADLAFNPGRRKEQEHLMKNKTM